MLARYMLSSCVCLSVRPSQVACSTKTTKPGITQTTLYDSPGTVVFVAKDFGEIHSGSLPTEAPNRSGVC